MISQKTIARSLIESTREESWDAWYSATRLAIADFLEECGAGTDAEFTRQGKLTPSDFEIGCDGGEDIRIFSLRCNSQGGTAFVYLSLESEDGNWWRVLEQVIGDGGMFDWSAVPVNEPVGRSLRVSVGDETPAGLVFGSLVANNIAGGTPLSLDRDQPRSVSFKLTSRWMARMNFRSSVTDMIGRFSG